MILEGYELLRLAFGEGLGWEELGALILLKTLQPLIEAHPDLVDRSVIDQWMDHHII